MRPAGRFPAILGLAIGLVSLSPLLSASAHIEKPSVPVAYDFEQFRQAVRSGGPPKDGIPAVDQPHFLSAADATLDDADRVIGLYYRGEARAYPQRILVWHEIVNDEVGGEPLSITYCPLTGTALGFKRGDTEFGVSGKLVNSNLVMYDRATDSEWPQILGVSIDGPVTGRGLVEIRVVWTTWGAWRARHPDTKVLSEQTGFVRNYRHDPYGSYNPLDGYYRPDSQRLFPVMHEDKRFPPKTPVFGVRGPGGALAITLEALRDEGVVDVTLGETHYTVIYDPQLETGWAFLNPQRESIDAALLEFTAEGLTGPGMAALEPINGFEAMWFAWVAFYPETTVYTAGATP